MSDPVIVYTAYTEEGGIRMSLHPEITSIPLRGMEPNGLEFEDTYEHRAFWQSNYSIRFYPSCRSPGVNESPRVSDPDSAHYNRVAMSSIEAFDWLLEEIYP